VDNSKAKGAVQLEDSVLVYTIDVYDVYYEPEQIFESVFISFPYKYTVSILHQCHYHQNILPFPSLQTNFSMYQFVHFQGDSIKTQYIDFL